MADLILTARELQSAVFGLKGVGDREFKSPKGSYAITKIKRQANAALSDLEATRIALCTRHAKKDDAGQPVKVKSEQGVESFVFADPAAFDADWKATLDEPVTLSGCRALTLDEFDGTGVTPDELLSLGPLVVEGE